jgi:hypothetical protein
MADECNHLPVTRFIDVRVPHAHERLDERRAQVPPPRGRPPLHLPLTLFGGTYRADWVIKTKRLRLSRKGGQVLVSPCAAPRKQLPWGIRWAVSVMKTAQVEATSGPLAFKTSRS